MGLTPPSDVVWVLGLLGFNWPMADEEGLLASSHHVRRFGTEVDHVHRSASAVADSVRAQNRGASVDAFHEHWQEIGGEGGHISQLRTEVEILADVLEVYSGVVLATKLAIIGAIVAFAAELTATTASAIFDFGASELAVPAEEAGTKWIVQKALGQVREHVEQEVARRLEGLFKKGIKKFLLRELRGSLEGAAMLGGYDLLKQEIDVHVLHIRRNVNWGEFAELAGGGAAMGAVSMAMTSGGRPPHDEDTGGSNYNPKSRDKQDKPKFKSKDALQRENADAAYAADQANLNKPGRQELHRRISKRHVSRDEMVEIAQEIAEYNPKKYTNK